MITEDEEAQINGKLLDNREVNKAVGARHPFEVPNQVRATITDVTDEKDVNVHTLPGRRLSSCD